MGFITRALSKSEYEERRASIWRMWTRGTVQREIAKAHGISDRQVRYELKLLEDRWKAETAESIAEEKERILQENQELLRTCWEAWERSLIVKRAEMIEKVEGGGDGPVSRKQLKKENSGGTPAFLDGVGKCLDRRCKILGIGQTNLVSGTPGRVLIYLPDNQREAEAVNE